VSKLNESFIAVTDKALAVLGKADDATKDKAELFGVGATVFSKYRNGEREVTKVAAKKMADRWMQAASKSEAERDELAERLYATARGPDAGNAEALAWIRSLAQPDRLVLGEFRDLPVARPTGPHDGLADDMGHAIAKGLNYAMIWPFSELCMSPSSTGDLHQRNYLSSMWSFVEAAYQNLMGQLAAAIIEGYAAELDPTEAWDMQTLKGLLVKASTRLRLYRLKKDAAGQLGPCPGFASKVFLVCDRGGQAQVWIWVSAQDAEHVIRKKSDETEILALASRFYPIRECFELNGTLPDTAELDQFFSDDRNEGPEQSPWEESSLSAHTLNRIFDREISINGQAASRKAGI